MLNLEDAHSAAIFSLIEVDSKARVALLQRLGVRSDGVLHPVSKASQWRYSKVEVRWWETDIFILLEFDGKQRHAVHIENKVAAGFTPEQAANYHKRAHEWASRAGEEYASWTIALIAPEAYLARHCEQCSAFPVQVSHEELEQCVPNFPKVGSTAAPATSDEDAGRNGAVEDKLLRVFFDGAWATPTRIRTREIGTNRGPQTREFELDRFELEQDIVDGKEGYWVNLPASELNSRGITAKDVVCVEAADVS